MGLFERKVAEQKKELIKALKQRQTSLHITQEYKVRKLDNHWKLKGK